MSGYSERPVLALLKAGEKGAGQVYISEGSIPKPGVDGSNPPGRSFVIVTIRSEIAAARHRAGAD